MWANLPIKISVHDANFQNHSIVFFYYPCLNKLFNYTYFFILLYFFADFITLN